MLLLVTLWGPPSRKLAHFLLLCCSTINTPPTAKTIWGQGHSLITGLPLGGRTPYITSKNRLHTPKLHIRDVPRTSENSLVRPKMDIETSCLQKKPAHIYQITVVPAKSDSDVMFCLQSYQGLKIDRSLEY